MPKPLWVTPAGTLGTFSRGQTLIIGAPGTPILLANAVLPATTVTYQLLTGLLPYGLTLSARNGYIAGTITSAAASDVYSFTIRAVDNLGNSSDRTFFMNVQWKPQWVTASGSLGSFNSLTAVTTSVVATPSTPAISISYSLLAGSLPSGLTLSIAGVISGTTESVSVNTTYNFVVRAIDNFGAITDRTFSMEVLLVTPPSFVTVAVTSPVNEFQWFQQQIQFTNTLKGDNITIELYSGSLPSGIELTTYGLLQGYPRITGTYNFVLKITGTTGYSLSATYTMVVQTATPYIPTILNTKPLSLSLSDTDKYYGYYVPSSQNSYASFNGYITPTVAPSTFTGYVQNDILIVTAAGPILVSGMYLSIGMVIPTTIINQILPLITGETLGGVGRYYILDPQNFTSSTITSSLTTLTVTNIAYGTIENNQYLTGVGVTSGTKVISQIFPLITGESIGGVGRYYVNVSQTASETIINSTASSTAYIGSFYDNDYFAFKVNGYDFGGSSLTYTFTSLPAWLTGDTQTGWVTGTPTTQVGQFSFDVTVTNGTPVTSSTYSFSFYLNANLNNGISWVTSSSLGTINDSEISMLSVSASATYTLSYRLVYGTLPPNLELMPDGTIVGRVAYQPLTTTSATNDQNLFVFTVEAYNPLYGTAIASTKTFSLTVVQKYPQPVETLYFKAGPSLADRTALQTLLDDTNIFPPNDIYRPSDPYFGKATEIIYEHCYGVDASELSDYVNYVNYSILKNNYWRDLTLGELKTAVAKNAAGEIIYEVVYSRVIDNLINSSNVSVSDHIVWPYQIVNVTDSNNAMTSRTDIFTSYDLSLNSTSTYFTSLTHQPIRDVYPNSLYNMRKNLASVINVEKDTSLLPLWMTSQQTDGSTYGYIEAWVICYTKPGKSSAIKTKIENKNLWPYTLNEMNFQINRLEVDKSATYNYYNNNWTSLPSAKSISITITAVESPNILTASSSIQDWYVDMPFKLVGTNFGGVGAGYLQSGITYYIKYIDITLNKFTVSRSLTAATENLIATAVSLTVIPDHSEPKPLDSKDYDVVFLQETILPVT